MLIKNKISILLIISLFTFSIATSSCCARKKNKKTETELKQDDKPTSVIRDTSYHASEILDYKILNAEVINNILKTEVSYKGGCGNHSWQLMWTGVYMKSLPMKIPLTIHHQATDETCNDEKTIILNFDLSLMIPPNKSEKIILLLKGFDENIEWLIVNN